MQGLVKYKLRDTETLVLEIESSFIKQGDDLSKMLGIEFKPTKMYRFKNSSLISEEKDIKPLSIEDLSKISLIKGQYYLKH